MFVASQPQRLTGLCLALLRAGLFILLFGSQPVHAQSKAKPEKAPASPLKQLGDDYQNSIYLLQNRFRIDHNVDEVTMIFFREYGSAPVVLIRPDGSKIFQSRAEESQTQWYDSDTFDMITLKNPVAGPWQAIGQIQPGSRIMVVSDIRLHAQPLPDILFSGEILKLTASLTNAGQELQDAQFRDVVDISIDLASTNNPNYDNFGADTQTIATFSDNGRGMDERPMDGKFTGQFNLSIAAGEWVPTYRVVTPMFSREQVGEPIILHRNPLTMSVELTPVGQGYHILSIDVNRELIDINSLLVDGKVRFPNGDIQNFSITETSGEARQHKILSYEEGTFRVKMTAYGTTTDGRDFILDVPEYTFISEFEAEDTTDMVPDPQNPEMAPAQETDSTAMTPGPLNAEEEAEEQDNGALLRLILIINGAIIAAGLLAAGVIVMIKRRKARSVTAPVKADKVTESEEPGKKAGLMNKLKLLFKKKPKTPSEDAN